jgi:hypothetical protein
MNKKTVSIAVVTLIVGVGIGYVGANSLRPATPVRGTFPGATGGNFGGMRAGGTGGLLSGTVAAKDATSITINTRDGSSHVVLISPSTTVSKSVSGSESDISVGSTIIVSGTTNSGGSVSATLIQLRPTP